MNFTDLMNIGEVLDKFENKCPCCEGTLFQGNIDEYYDVWCECGLEIRIRFKDKN